MGLTLSGLRGVPGDCRREAKNFYYAFVALPKPRRNAICAIYAFMRQADDLADDESVPRESARASGCVAGGWRAACRAGDERSGVSCGARCDGALQIPLTCWMSW
jgi:15-cis-phytoene synthase